MRRPTLFIFIPFSILLLLTGVCSVIADDGGNSGLPQVEGRALVIEGGNASDIRRADGPPITDNPLIVNSDIKESVKDSDGNNLSVNTKLTSKKVNDNEQNSTNEEEKTDDSNTSPRSDTDPEEDSGSIPDHPHNETTGNNKTIKTSASTSVRNSPSIQLTTSTASWLDIFMLDHRDTLWRVINSLFMVVWLVLCFFSLYRLLDLNLCSPHLSRTQYLVIHLLGFTAGVFEIVQLLHLNFGRQRGLPLFLTLLLTHTPTPLLATCLITMCFCIFSSSRVAIFGRFFPPLLYVGVLCSALIVMSFVGDIIVGVSRSSVFLLLVRLLINAVCVVCFSAFLFAYRDIASVARILRRELRSEALKPLAVPVPGDESHERKLHLKEILLVWTRLTFVSCLAGVVMCVCCFLMSIFFTASVVPLWAFWALHSTIFIMQVVIVCTLTAGATLTLTCCTKNNAGRQFFLPCMLQQRPPVTEMTQLTKRGDVIYQRVALPNGLVVAPHQRITVTPQPIEEEHQVEALIINHSSVEYDTPPPFKTRPTLRRSATFNCAPPSQHPFYGAAPPPPPPPPVSPVHSLLSDHLIPTPDAVDGGRFGRPSHQIFPAECDLPYRYISRYPSKSYYARDHFSSLRRTHSARRQRPDISGPLVHPDLAGTVEALEIAYQPTHSIAMRPQIQYSLAHKNSFNRSPHNAPDKPVRKVEPILVRGVIKENGVIESSRLVNETATLNPIAMIGSYSKRDETLPDQLYESPSKLSFSPPSSPLKNEFLYGNNISTPRESSPEKSYSKKYPKELPISPVAHVNGNTKDFHSFSKASNPDLNFTPHSPTRPNKIAMGSRSPALSYRANHSQQSPLHHNPLKHNTSMESASLATPESISLKSSSDLDGFINNSDDDDNCSEKTLKDESSMNSLSLTTNSHDDSSLSPPMPDDTKRKSLKRNHSTAGDFVPQRRNSEDQNAIEACTVPSNKDKYPWYGTWGGRKNRKRSGIETGRGLAQYGINRRSGSKTSLSSLYGKLRKPGRSKSMYQNDPNKSGDEISNDESELEDSKSVDLDLKRKEDDEEDLFLPRLAEEIDLESEIFKSSTMLANFYSLNRSELKQRRKEKQMEENGNWNENGSQNDLMSRFTNESLNGSQTELKNNFTNENENLNGFQTDIKSRFTNENVNEDDVDETTKFLSNDSQLTIVDKVGN